MSVVYIPFVYILEATSVPHDRGNLSTVVRGPRKSGG